MKRFPGVSLLLLGAGLLPGADISFWIEPCSVMTTGCQASDMDLARWALTAWEKASEGKVHFVETRQRADARFRVRWADQDSGLFGEAVTILVNGRRGSELHIQLPPPNRDPLLRDTIVYLTCLHESGHALGLPHTRGFADIMYNFQFGGDLDEYFNRYRRLLSKREDIREHPGMSDADRAVLLKRVEEAVGR
jgi:hypothetical protein